MPEQPGTTAAHLEAVRHRGRWLMASEGAEAVPYEVLHSCSAARDSAVIIFAIQMILFSARLADHTTTVLFAAAVALALYTGTANMLAIAAQLRYWASELRRERREIREQPEFERDEIRALYEAKGFTGPILEKIVDTLCGDEDRLLKIMMEEELGIFMEQSNHPVVIGVITGVASLIGGLLVASTSLGPLWVSPLGLAVFLGIISLLRTGRFGAAAIEGFARWLLATGTVAGVAYFLGQALGN